jgi:hypothetical protein
MLKYLTLLLNQLPRSPDEPAAPVPPSAPPASGGTPPAGDPVPPPADPPSLLNADDPAPPKEGDAPKEPPKEGDAFTAAADVKMPEGFDWTSDDQKASFETLAKESGLSKEAAQKWLDYGTQALKASQEAGTKLWTDTQTEWQKQVRADPEIGSSADGLKKEVKTAIFSAINTYADDVEGTKQQFDLTGAGNNPKIVKLFYRMAKALSEAPSVPGRPAAQEKARPSAAEAIYPNLVNPTGT